MSLINFLICKNVDILSKEEKESKTEQRRKRRKQRLA